jgi:hypothetical protein
MEKDGNLVRGIHKGKPRMMNELEGNVLCHYLETEVVFNIYICKSLRLQILSLLYLPVADHSYSYVYVR